MPKLEMDFSSPDKYLSSLALLRQQIQLRRDSNSSPTVYRLVLRMPSGRELALFLQTSNLYLIGFRGRTKVFVVSDTAEDFKKTVEQSDAVSKDEEVTRLPLFGDHGSLKTFNRAFTLSDLLHSDSLADYTEERGRDAVNGPFSLLVCMISEAARFLQVQNEFAGVGPVSGRYFPAVREQKGIYFGEEITASRIVNDWASASRARKLAAKAGLGAMEGHEKAKLLESTMSELEDLLTNVKFPVPQGKAQFLELIFSKGTAPFGAASALPAVQLQTTKVRQILTALKLGDAESAAEFIAALRYEIPIKASLGLLLPAV